jgi:hypothetical protein
VLDTCQSPGRCAMLVVLTFDEIDMLSRCSECLRSTGMPNFGCSDAPTSYTLRSAVPPQPGCAVSGLMLMMRPHLNWFFFRY